MSLLMLLAACSLALTEDQRFAEQVKENVRWGLKDPDSANFERVEAFAKEHVACGRVNAKNAYGGYTGYENFSFYNGNAHLQSDDLKAYLIGSTRCLIIHSERAIEDIKTDSLPQQDKKAMIDERMRFIDKLKRDATFGL
ncbi:MAG: hypothetical protein QHC40_07900 [Sphingobium sp.]|nr:hypothetical protein [Sphingobium sp.]